MFDIQVKVCFLCKQYTPIHPENPISCEFVKQFEGWHHGHPVETILKEEVPDDFQCITPKKREEIFGALFNDIKS